MEIVDDSTLVRDFLAAASECQVDADVREVRRKLQASFGYGPLKYLTLANGHSSMQAGKPVIFFELLRMLSKRYFTVMRFQLLDGVFSMTVETKRSVGDQALKAATYVEEFRTSVVNLEEKPISRLAEAGRDQAIAHQAMLLELAGLESSEAKAIAEKHWTENAKQSNSELLSQAMTCLRNQNGAGVAGHQLSRIRFLGAQNPAGVIELPWAQSLALAVIGGYFVPETELRQLTDLVSIDNEGYLYFDGIRGDNVGDGVTPVVVHAINLCEHKPKASEFECACMTALLHGQPIQNRHQFA